MSSANEDVGFVYVVQMDGSRYYKVGRTTDPPRRMSEFGILLPFAYTLVFAHQVHGSRRAEEILHSDFSSKRVHGEWFLLDEVDLSHARDWLLYMQHQWLVKRFVQSFYDSVFIEGDYAFPWFYRYPRIIRRLERRDERRLFAITKSPHYHRYRKIPRPRLELATEVVS